MWLSILVVSKSICEDFSDENEGRGIYEKNRPYQKIRSVFIEIVSEMRVELTRPHGHYPLKVACLPIPPPGLESA